MAEIITVRRVTRDGGLRKVLKGISSSLGPVTKYTFLSGRALHRRRLGPWVRRKSGITVLYLLPITELCRQLCGFLWLGRRQLPPAVQRYLSLMA
jgi:hypothetical protein